MKKKLTDSQREAKRARDRRYREKKRAEAKAAKVAPVKAKCDKKCAAKKCGHKTVADAVKNAKTVVFTGADVDIIACVVRGILREIMDIIGKFSPDISNAVICRLAKH